MNIFSCHDDFLSDEDFKKITALAEKRYPLIVKEHTKTHRDNHNPIRSRDLQFEPGQTSLPVEGIVRYGDITADVIDQIYRFLVNDTKVINPELSTVWFAYMTPEQTLDYHCDGPVRGIPIEKCITVCLYIHDQWQDEWGGEIESEEGTKYSPTPNRMVIWSRDIIHRVSEITAAELPTKRMIMATTWTTEGRRNDL